MNSEIIMYQTEDGLTKIETTFDNDTVWPAIDQMTELFQRNKSVIGKHIITTEFITSISSDINAGAEVDVSGGHK
jgi:hypothetical protein